MKRSMLLIMLVGCAGDTDKGLSDTATATTTVPAGPAVEDVLTAWLVGTFDSTKQASEDFSFFEVQLVACRVPVSGFDTHTIYVEQAYMDDLDNPYRQRVYTVDGMEEDGWAETRVFGLDDPAAAIHLCDEPERLSLRKANLDLRVGCGVQVEWVEETRFVGGTTDDSCQNSLAGATYATSEVTITDSRIASLDQGFTDDGTKVWGADEAYIFRRQDDVSEAIPYEAP